MPVYWYWMRTFGSTGCTISATSVRGSRKVTVIGSGPQTRVVALKQPLDGHSFEATLRALFPPVLADRVMNGQFRTEPTLPVLQSQFERSAAAAAARASATSG